MKKEVWIALVGVKPQPANDLLEGAKGAFVNILAFVSSETEYVESIKRVLEAMNFDVFQIENIEPIKIRQSRVVVEKYLCELADQVENTGEAAFGTFHTFENERDQRK